jgi:hypothetical protein
VHANTSTPDASDNVHFREERITPGNEPLQDSITKDKPNNATIFEHASLNLQKMETKYKQRIHN